MPSKLASPRKLASARANGALSHGPVTPDGKARAARNALKHGLTAGSVVLSTECIESYQALRDGYYAQFSPRTLYERDLLDLAVAALWRARRAMTLESAAYDVETERQRPKVDREFASVSADIRVALVFQSDVAGDKNILNLAHLASRFSREYRRIIQLLTDLLDRPPVGPTVCDTEAVLPDAPSTASSAAPAQSTEKNRQNEPNPISGQQGRIVRFVLRDPLVAPDRTTTPSGTYLVSDAT